MHSLERVRGNFQLQFERKWGHLTHPHVRALAWLLDAPDLLDPADSHWRGKIASLGALQPADADWLAAQERDPAPLVAALGHHSRLGLYAEKLMAFYFQQQGVLVAHGLQVRANKNDTVGEFDFLLRCGDALLHWEFATKFYLFEGNLSDGQYHCLIGPNLADTLGLKMRKILDQQLALGRHPAAQSLLPQTVDSAQALVKGWLFYRDGVVPPMAGISPSHNRGFWCTQEQVASLAADRFIVVPRLQWLAPLKVPVAGALPLRRGALQAALIPVGAPVLVAIVREENGWLLEQERGFIVPDDWPSQAAAWRRTRMPG